MFSLLKCGHSCQIPCSCLTSEQSISRADNDGAGYFIKAIIYKVLPTPLHLMNHLMAASHWSMTSNTGLWLAACPSHHVITPRVLTKMVLMDQDGQDTITSHLPGPPSLWFWLIVPNIIPGAQSGQGWWDRFICLFTLLDDDMKVLSANQRPVRGPVTNQKMTQGQVTARWVMTLPRCQLSSDSALCEPFVSLGLSSPINIHNHHF